jgi:pimeloyl-ACP methyl ester carboxylesterase
MMAKIWLNVVWGVLVAAASAWGQRADAREGVVRFMEMAGLEGYLAAGVEVGRNDAGVLEIADGGTFVVQYMIVGPESAAEPNVVVDAGVEIAATADKIVVVTHGWIDRASSRWPADIAAAIAEKTDPNEWVCAVFDWQGGAGVINPVDAARYGRDIGGPRLAAGVRALGRRFRHVHLIGHSAGSWTISSAARRLCETAAPETLHLTYLDAYIPPQWQARELTAVCEADSQVGLFAEHYYTRDITLSYTEYDLPGALNVDITDIDPWFKEHEFPYRWYFASITGRYARFDEKKSSLVTSDGRLTYGFARSMEAGAKNWQESVQVEKGARAARLRPAKVPFSLDFFRK